MGWCGEVNGRLSRQGFAPCRSSSASEQCAVKAGPKACLTTMVQASLSKRQHCPETPPQKNLIVATGSIIVRDPCAGEDYPKSFQKWHTNL